MVSLCDRFVGIDSGLLHAAAALRVPFVGLFTHLDPQLRLIGARDFVAIRATGLDCIPCGDFAGEPECAGTDRFCACAKALDAAVVWKALNELREGEGELRTAPVSPGQMYRPPRDRPRLTFVVPWLAPSGGERHLHYLCEGLHLDFDIDLVVTHPEQSHCLDGAFDRWSVTDLEGGDRARVRKLAAHMEFTRPQVLVFYNNCLALDALHHCDHRPERVVAIIHTVFEHEVSLTTHEMSHLVNSFVCVSESAHEALRSRSGIDPNRLPVIRNGVGLERIETAESLGIKSIGLRHASGLTQDLFAPHCAHVPDLVVEPSICLGSRYVRGEAVSVGDHLLQAFGDRGLLLPVAPLHDGPQVDAERLTLGKFL